VASSENKDMGIVKEGGGGVHIWSQEALRGATGVRVGCTDYEIPIMPLPFFLI